MKATVLTKETILDYEIKDRKFPEFRVGDTIEVGQIVKEGNKQRVQLYKGDVIAISNNGISSTFTVRKLSADGVFVERIFPYYSPMIDGVAIVKTGDVRRAKLYYLRDKVGKMARIKEMVLTKEQKEAKAALSKE
ncbi:50S ribosomal protein L19 [Candidatus Dependentiae bacterium]|nr:50S ribosomal protein L19 [Candidatus Dependentiae bacterium]MBU4387379.1 50S ribosomal protein L19 [Candidatus Dependentiae bacterium]MCG2756581.1 50S ribosomal protein L19 [Candidatus Dependentiae bacterium]